MTCADAREHFSAWVDEALAADLRAAVGAHLAECPDCRRELSRVEATVGLLGRVEPPRAPAGFVDRVLEVTRPPSWRRRLYDYVFSPLSVKLPAEAAALFLVAGLAWFVFHQTPELQQAAQMSDASRPATRDD
jgi:anti-sigma factor RsiW